MKLSYSIQNWNNRDWKEFCETAIDARLQGIEIYGIEGPVFQGKGSPTNPVLSAATRRYLTNRNLCIPCIDTACDFTDPAFAREFSASVQAAVNLGIEYIGIHTSCEEQDVCIAKMGELLGEIAARPVTLLVETTKAYTDTQRLRDLLNTFSDDHLAALWNMFGTYAIGKEDAETTITNLGAYVRHVHIHDFRSAHDAPFPELIGEGELPILEMMNALRSVNYDGFISLLWDPFWMPELPDIEIILTHFANCMSRFENTKRGKKHLYWNNRHRQICLEKRGADRQNLPAGFGYDGGEFSGSAGGQVYYAGLYPYLQPVQR